MAEEEEITAMIVAKEEETKAKIRLIVMCVFFASVFSLATIVAAARTLSIVAR